MFGGGAAASAGLGCEGLEFGAGGVGGEEAGLTRKGGFKFAGEFEPLLFWAG